MSHSNVLEYPIYLHPSFLKKLKLGIEVSSPEIHISYYFTSMFCEILSYVFENENHSAYFEKGFFRNGGMKKGFSIPFVAYILE